MLFKNLVVYRLPEGWSLSAADLEQRLERSTLQPCGPLEMSCRGWVIASPTGRLVHTVGQHQLIALGTEQKLLPSSVIRQFTKDRAVEIAAEQGFPLGRRQMRDLKLRVTEELRARALTRRVVTAAWIDPVGGWFVVEAASANRAEQVVEFLRKSIDSFAVQPLKGDRSPQPRMAAWLLYGDVPQDFLIENDLELKAADKSKATVRYSRHPFEPRQVQTHIENGLVVTRVGLSWSGRVSFVLNEKLEVKRVEFLGISSEPGDGGGEADAAEQFDIDFALMTGELSQLLVQVDAAFGATAAAEDSRG
jgi:recombination associated protein RdgC